MRRTSRARLALILLATGCLLGSGAALGRAAEHPAVAVTPNGDARFTWTRPDGASISTPAVIVTRGLTGSTLDEPQDLSDPFEGTHPPRPVFSDDSDVALAADGSAWFTWRQVVPGCANCAHIRRRAADGGLDDTDVLNGLPPAGLGVDAGGTAVVALLTRVLKAQMVHPGGVFTAVEQLSTGDTREAAVAVAPNGDATFAWTIRRSHSTDEIVRTRIRRADGTLTPVKDVSALAPDPGGGLQPQVAIDAAGDVTFAWRHFDGAHMVVQTRRRTAGGTFSAVRDLSDPGADADHLRLAVNGSDAAAFSWLRAGRVQARTRRADDDLAPVKTISPAGGEIADPSVGIDAAGNATFAWTRSDGANPIVQSRRRKASTGAFQDVRDVSAADVDARDLRLAVAAGGDAVFAWTSQVGSTEPCQACGVQGRRIGAAGALGPILDLG